MPPSGELRPGRSDGPLGREFLQELEVLLQFWEEASEDLMEEDEDDETVMEEDSEDAAVVYWRLEVEALEMERELRIHLRRGVTGGDSQVDTCEWYQRTAAMLAAYEAHPHHAEDRLKELCNQWCQVWSDHRLDWL